MGLDTSHDCWHGPYSMFMRWREWIAAQAFIPLHLMEGFCEWYYDEEDVLRVESRNDWTTAGVADRNIVRTLAQVSAPLPWSLLRDDPLVILLHHSDCDGRIRWFDCKKLALRLIEILRSERELPPLHFAHPAVNDPGAPQRGCYDGFRKATKRFIFGLMRAYKSKEDVIFR